MIIIANPYCPYCGSTNTSRFEWAKQLGFEYWTCWDCDRSFAVWKEVKNESIHSQSGT